MRLSLHETVPDFIRDVLPSNELHIGKLQGVFASLDACDAAMKLGSNLIKTVDTVAQEKQVPTFKINDQEIKKNLNRVNSTQETCA